MPVWTAVPARWASALFLTTRPVHGHRAGTKWTVWTEWTGAGLPDADDRFLSARGQKKRSGKDRLMNLECYVRLVRVSNEADGHSVFTPKGCAIRFDARSIEEQAAGIAFVGIVGRRRPIVAVVFYSQDPITVAEARSRQEYCAGGFHRIPLRCVVGICAPSFTLTCSESATIRESPTVRQQQNAVNTVDSCTSVFVASVCTGIE